MQRMSNLMFPGKKVNSISYKGYEFEFDMMLLAAGFEPNNFLAGSSSIQTGKFSGIKVDEKLRKSDFNIFDAGDAIEVKNKITGKWDYIPLATLAYLTGHIAGENEASGNAYIKPVIKNISVKVFEKYLSCVGINSSEAVENKFNFSFVTATADNLVKVTPDSKEVFGKILFEKLTKKILGALFLGGREVSGFADLIASFIQNDIRADELSNIHYNYTPSLSPFVNLLSILGRKINKELS